VSARLNRQLAQLHLWKRADARQFWLMATAGVEDFPFCVDKPLPQRYVFSKT
jgi:hypothetical protein